MGDIADDMLDDSMTEDLEYHQAYVENSKFNDSDLVEALIEDDHGELINSICEYYNKTGFISKKQRNVLLDHLTRLDITFR